MKDSQDSIDSIVKPLSIVSGHSECRSLDETVPVLAHVLALEVVKTGDKQVTMKHPNTGWLLVLHEGGPEAQDKPERHHYGMRVSNNAEVDRAYEYLLVKKDELHLKKVVKRRERDGSYSMFFVEPGGNYWEIESYENRHKAGLPRHVAYPWKEPLSAETFPGRGYIPQAFTHGTIECTNLESSVKFYKNGLGLHVISHLPNIKPHDIKHPSFPWYVVSLQIPEKNRRYQNPQERFTLAVDSSSNVVKAHKLFNERREEFGITEIGALTDDADRESFLVSDLDRNWWEIAYQRNWPFSRTPQISE